MNHTDPLTTAGRQAVGDECTTDSPLALRDPKVPGRAREEVHWFAIYTRSRFEKKFYEAVRRSDRFDVFLPLVKERRVWSDRIKTVEVPLLPGYVFVRLPSAEIRQLYYLPGFVRVIGFEGKPCCVRASEMELLERIVRHGLSAEQTAPCRVGDRVRILRGPLRGWEGRVDRRKGTDRIIFHFECIRQAISVEVGVGEVEVV